jgi:GTP-binding protein
VRDSETGEVLGDLARAGMELLVARGGKGGWGNQRFKSSKNRSPRQYGPGLPGEIARARLELKVIADVGLLGLPNAGKSTLISACPRRGPRSPTIRSPRCIRTWAWSPAATSAASSWPTSRASSKVPRMAPASASVSCKHLQRTRVLLHLVDIAPVDPNADPVRDARSIVGELGKFSEDLLAKPRWLVLNKSDLMPRMKRAAKAIAIAQALDYRGPAFLISGATMPAPRTVRSGHALPRDRRGACAGQPVLPVVKPR